MKISLPDLYLMQTNRAGEAEEHLPNTEPTSCERHSDSGARICVKSVDQPAGTRVRSPGEKNSQLCFLLLLAVERKDVLEI